MKKMVLGLMVGAGILGTSTVAANAADTGEVVPSTTGDVAFSSGTLSLSVVDNTNLSFGKNTISAANATLGASTTPTVKVSDLRGTNDGWSLTVAQGQQFNTKTDATGSALTNAALTVFSTKVSSDDPKVNEGHATLTPGTTTPGTTTSGTTTSGTTTSGTTTNGAAGTVASALAGDGNGISTFKFGSSTLTVPGATPKLAQGYTTTLTWNLGATPSND
ncbi:WxL domain-containing protein [Loigolactobacillus binensis]|uniref:WxL domain-containing protein n=1 Tax=Loigolactobacillus binensis TaxID=2559922 RepID=A0ABW3EGR6_9LACO|nr:WxL domain-containing protein [Loigolactobacillus binensis]